MIQSAALFDAFNRLNVLVVGDVMIDRYLSGHVSRISPEAPVPVVQLQSFDNRLGGAANVALNLRALGANPYLCSVIGRDENAPIFLDLLPKNHLPQSGITQSAARMTTVKTRVIAAGQQLLRVDREQTDDLSEEDAAALLSCIRSLLDEVEIHVILFQDYNKGVLTPRVIAEVIREGNKRAIPTTVDPKFNNFWAYKGVTLFKPNLKEIRAQLPGVEVNPESLRGAAEQLRDRLANKHSLITLSEKGLYYFSNGRGEIIPTQPRSIADVCGAGDTVISIASLGIALGLDMREIAVLANLAGGQVCERVGVAPVDKAQLREEYEALILLA